MSIKKLKEQTEKWSFSEIILSDRWFYPVFFFFGVGVIGMEMQKKQTKEEEEDLTKK